jgi:prepilin-type N-terminal cleavage/methylation domain-containing protein
MKFSVSSDLRGDEKRGSASGLRPSNGRRAFTLIEIMVAIILFSLVVAAICATLVLILRATTVGQAAAARAQRQRVVMNTLENSLMCIQSFQASPQYYSFIVNNGDSPVLSFAARLPAVFPRNGKFISPELGRDFKLRRVTFSLEPGPDRQDNLVLRQKSILMDMDAGEVSDPVVLAQNVNKFIIECWDTNQMDWVDEWDNTNTLPPMVRIGLILNNGDNNNNNNNDADSQPAIVRVFSLPSTMMPTVVQLGAGGGGLLQGLQTPATAAPGAPP